MFPVPTTCALSLLDPSLSSLGSMEIDLKISLRLPMARNADASHTVPGLQLKPASGVPLDDAAGDTRLADDEDDASINEGRTGTT